MRRRELLLGTATALPTAAGCSSLGGSDAPEYDCSRSSRPEPSAPDRSDAVAPATYPGPPENPGNDAQIVAFVEEFEAAYRRNRLVGRWRGEMTSFGFSTSENWTVDSAEDTGVAGIEYTFYYETGGPEETDVHADSPYHTAVSYVDGSVALRAHREGSRSRGDVPDPREDGDEVACYE